MTDLRPSSATSRSNPASETNGDAAFDEALAAARSETPAPMVASPSAALQGSQTQDAADWDEIAADATKDVAAGTTGYRGAMYGEVGAGPYTANIGKEQKFGRFAPGATLARPSFTGYGIDKFATRRGWQAPQQTLVSSQAAWGYARQQARATGLSPSQITFETTHPLGDPARAYDVGFRGRPAGAAPVDSVTEIKAGKTITPSQLTRDITAANRGLDVDYRFAGNPITGNHGPDPDVAARLNAAQSATNGRFHWAVTDVSPSSASLHSVETAAKVSRAARVFGRVAAPIGLAADTYSIGSAIAADGGRFGRNTTVAVAGSAGGWAGAAAGGWAGVQTGTAIGALVGGPAGAAVGAVVGGLIGAVGGGWFGGWGGEKIARAATD